MSRLTVFFALIEQISGFPLAGRAYGFGPDNFAFFVDQDGGTVADSWLIEPNAISFADFALGVEVGEQGVCDAAKAVSPGFVTEF